jgi:voltage-gated potassium channel Kch
MLRELLVAFAIVAVCVVMHTTGVVIFAEWLLKRRDLLARTGWTNHTLWLIWIFAVILVLHLAETGIWALFYYKQGLFENFETSLYFSLSSYTTIGYGDVVLPQRWRLLGAVEGLSGVLLSGVSTAFIFAIVNGILQIRNQGQSGPSE